MMSMRPQASIAAWTSASGAPSCVRSPAYTTVSPAISDAVCSATSPSRSLTTTRAPCSHSSSAVARPIPRADPVTIATLSSSTPMLPPVPVPDGGFCPLEPVRAPDHLEHDLVGAGPDPVEPHVAPHALDAVLLHVAGPAVDLEALVAHPAGHPRGEDLRHRDLAHRVLAVAEPPRGRVDELPRRLDLRRHLGELVPDHLEAADRAPERLPLHRVLQRPVERLLRGGDAARRADHPLALELPHDVVEALALLAEQCIDGHAHVLERQQRRVGSVHAELLQLLLAHDPGQVHVHDEQADAVVAGVGIGLGDEHDEVGAV